MQSPTTTNIQISTDRKKLDIDYIHDFLSKSYWAKGIPKGLVERSIENSFCFGIFQNKQQIGFARVVTDYTTFGFLADVFVDTSKRGNGYGRILVDYILNHDDLKDLRRWHLLTNDAHPLYQPHGFKTPEYPERHMEKCKSEVERQQVYNQYLP